MRMIEIVVRLIEWTLKYLYGNFSKQFSFKIFEIRETWYNYKTRFKIEINFWRMEKLLKIIKKGLFLEIYNNVQCFSNFPVS